MPSALIPTRCWRPISDWSFWVCLPLAGILAAFFGVLLGFPVLRLRGDYLAIVTLAFGEIIRLVIINWQSLTGGPNGVSGIPRPSFFGIPLTPGDDGLAANSESNSRRRIASCSCSISSSRSRCSPTG